MSATSVEGSCPTTSASLRTPSENLTEMSSAPSTTCWLVTMCPALSTTNPDPPPGPASDVAATSTLTTPRPSRVYTSRTEEPSFETGRVPDDRGDECRECCLQSLLRSLSVTWTWCSVW